MNLTELKFDLTRLKAQLLLAKGNWSHKGRPGMRGGSGGGGVIEVAEQLSQGRIGSVVYKEIPIDDLRATFITNRKINQSKVVKIAESIQITKQVKPIIVTSLPNGKFHIEDGHHRLLAIRSIRGTQVPAYIVDKNIHNMNTASGQELASLYKSSKEKVKLNY